MKEYMNNILLNKNKNKYNRKTYAQINKYQKGKIDKDKN